MTDNRCILPWISLETTPLGNLRPCCLFDREIPFVNVKTHTLTEVLQGEYMTELREAFMKNRQPGQCAKCFKEEDAGKKSKRQYMLEKFKDIEVNYEDTRGDTLRFLDLKLGNICNLKCRICGSWSSSAWAQEDLAQFGEKHIAKQWLSQGRWPRSSKKFWEHVDELLPDIKYFEFTGGEPFLIKQHFDLLQRAADGGYAGDIDIHYNTNGTQFPKQHEVWKKFKRVQIAFSIDNVGERFEYERDGAKWATVNRNIEKFYELRDQGYPFEFQICVTWNVQNVMYMADFLTWVKKQPITDVHYNLMHDPEEFSLYNLPKTAKAPVMLALDKCIVQHPDYEEKIRSIKFIVSQRSDENDGEKLKKRLKEKDDFRDKNFATTHEKFARVIGYER
jgi:molybdenum cofactor biosynthesis enzyme MoaA